MTVRTDTGTEERDVPQAQRDQQVLDDATTAQLTRYGEQIEAHYDAPMDIEWAIADGEIAIVQARPITTLPDPKPAPLTDVRWEPIAPKTIWMRRQIVEHMPEPLSPLFEDLYLNQGMNQSMGKMLRAMGEIGGVKLDLQAMIPHGFAGTINGYAYTSGSFKMTRAHLMAFLRIFARIFKSKCLRSTGMGSCYPNIRRSSRAGGPLMSLSLLKFEAAAPCWSCYTAGGMGPKPPERSHHEEVWHSVGTNQMPAARTCRWSTSWSMRRPSSRRWSSRRA